MCPLWLDPHNCSDWHDSGMFMRAVHRTNALLLVSL